MRRGLHNGALVALLLSGTARAQDGPASLIERFAAGFATSDPQVMAAMFRPDATLFGSAEPDLLRGPEGARGYFTRAWPPGWQRQLSCDVLNAREVSAAATLEAWCRFEGVTPDGAPRSLGLRVSALAMRDEAGWRFASLHVSAPPPRR